MSCLLGNYRGAVGIKTVFIIILLSVFTIFILQNTEVVEIKFLFWELNMSRVILLLAAMFTGILVGLFIGWEASLKKGKNK